MADPSTRPGRRDVAGVLRAADRTPPRRSALAALTSTAATALLLASCGGGSKPAASGASTTAPGDAGPTSTTLADDAAPATEPAGGDAAPTTASAAGPPTSAATAAAPTPGGEGQRAAALTPTRPGRYRYSVTGSFRTTTGSQQAPPESIVTIDPPQGSDQREVRDLGAQGSVEQVYRYGADGVRIVSVKTGGGQQTNEMRPDPPALAYPWPAEVGQKWSYQGSQGGTSAKVDSEVLRFEEIDVAGERLSAVVVYSVSTTTGQVSATTRVTSWWSPQHRLVLQRRTEFEGSYAGQRYTGDTTEKLTSTAPA